MLHYEAVPPGAVDALIKLMRLDSLKDYYLVGGTSLALRYGHRLSIDLDLFTRNDVDFEAIKSEIRSLNWSSYKELFAQKSGMQLVLDDTKVDFVKYNYANIEPVETIDNVRLLSVQDVACMKLSAISQRGAKKDFYDLHLLLQHFTVEELLSFFKRKYPDLSTFHIVKSMNYYEDADIQAMPELRSNVSWDQLKKEIDEKVQQYLSNL